MKFQFQKTYLDVAAVTFGMALFGLLAHRTGCLFYVGLLGLVLAAFTLALCGFAAPHTSRLLGLERRNFSRAVCFFPLAFVVGFSLAMVYRMTHGQVPWPTHLHSFALQAVAIGMTEELVYRGYVFGRCRDRGIWIASFAGAFAHALYKGSLFVFPPSGESVNILLLVLITTGPGVFFGLAREYLGGTFFSLVAHVTFDLSVYGDCIKAPWWVWN